jgi:hypothetical protein
MTKPGQKSSWLAMHKNVELDTCVVMTLFIYSSTRLIVADKSLASPRNLALMRDIFEAASGRLTSFMPEVVRSTESAYHD